MPDEKHGGNMVGGDRTYVRWSAVADALDELDAAHQLDEYEAECVADSHYLPARVLYEDRTGCSVFAEFVEPEPASEWVLMYSDEEFSLYANRSTSQIRIEEHKKPSDPVTEAVEQIFAEAFAALAKARRGTK